MAQQRTYSFGRGDDDISYQPSRGAGGYQVASGSSYIPDPSRDDTSSPLSSVSSQPRGYSIPAPDQGQPRMSAYRTQRQEQAAAPTNSASQPQRKPLPVPPQASGSRDGQSYSIPIPPTYSRPSQDQQMFNQDTSYSNSQPYSQQTYDGHRRQPSPQRRSPYSDINSSQTGLAAAAAAAVPIMATPDYGDDRQPSPYRDNVSHSDSGNEHFRQSTGPRQGLGDIEPTEIDDDDDDPFASIPNRRAGGAAAAGVAAAGTGGFLKNLGSRDASGSYGAVPGESEEKPKKSDWLRQQTTGNKKLKWMVGGLIVLVIVLAVTGGAIGAVLSNKSSSSSSDATDVPASGQLNRDSPSIQELMNNPKLHKVFPGIDYNPLNAQYPACLTNPPLQNNITADVAVMSQLSPIVRLYGTDCQQTEMVLNAIKALGLEKSMKIWGGIYLDGNTTTNVRQISQMYSVLDNYGGDQFEGVIVGNEVLFSEYMSETELISKIQDVRDNLKKRGLSSLKVATSDLGSKWSSGLVDATDVVMANVHPFFGGVAAPQAATWTYNYWQNNDVVLTDGTTVGNCIAETGWPSQGGNYCATEEGSNIPCTSNTQGSVAGIKEMNLFMNDWVCKALDQGTDYFWFEAFDEPWKVIFDTKDEHWESKWGLLDVNRVLKPGLEIPNCGGKTAELKRR